MILILLLAFVILALACFFFAVGSVVRPQPLSTQVWVRITRFMNFIACLYLVPLLVLIAVHLVAPQKTGILALTQVLSPLLFIPAITFVPLVFARDNNALRWFAVFIVVVFLFRHPPSVTLPYSSSSNGEQKIRVMNWNVTISLERNQILRLRPLLQADVADVVVLQEAHWEWLRTDSAIRALYPHQFVHTEQASSGLVVLSRYPVLEHGIGSQLPGAEGWPRLVWAKLDLGQGTFLWIIAAHPESPYTSNRSDCRFPQCYDTQQRDSLIPQIRSIIDTALGQNAPVLLVGDLNTSEQEPQYTEFGRGLVDSHRQAGWGWGSTFGAFFTESSENINGRFFVPLLRFDYIFASPNLTTLSSRADCTLRGSEHCIVYASFVLP